jgi:TonB family protein
MDWVSEQRQRCYPVHSMRTQIFLALFLAPCLAGFGQTAATSQPGLPQDPRAILATAAPFYDFNDPTLKPFHIKATYQLYDVNGKPEEQGRWEYWYVSSKEYRSSWVRADAARTEWHTANGALYRKETGKALKYFERNITVSIFHPLPAEALLNSGRLHLETQNVQVGSQTMPCVVTFLQRTVEGRPQAPPSSVGTRYCFDPLSHALLVSYSNAITAEYLQIVKLQDRYLPRELNFFAGKVKLFALSIETIDNIIETDATLIPATDAVMVTPSQISQSNGSDPDADVALGRLVKKYPPEYPAMAKMVGVQGEVVLAAIISKEGRIQDLEVLASPSSMLTKPALDAVKRWEYAPYLLNGEPVEVESIINVYFTLDR